MSDGTDVRYTFPISGIFLVPRKCHESKGAKDSKNRDDDDEFDESESFEIFGVEHTIKLIITTDKYIVIFYKFKSKKLPDFRKFFRFLFCNFLETILLQES